MTFTKIQVIQILRKNIAGLGLKDAKILVDAYELKFFEDRVARSLGEGARDELHSWALLYAKECGLVYTDAFACNCDLCIAEKKAYDYKEVVLD